MTKEEAIIIFQESLRQNKVIQESPNTFFRSVDIADGMKNAERRIEAFNMAIAALHVYAQQDTSPNDPLTLEQLREMDGEPVWVVQVDGEFRPFWMLVDVEDESASNRLYAAMFEDYGTGWLAYRRKPEEGTI